MAGNHQRGTRQMRRMLVIGLGGSGGKTLVQTDKHGVALVTSVVAKY